MALIVGVAAGLVVGLVFGLVNGIGVARFKVSPFIMTLGMASVGSGFALYYTGGSPVSGMPPLFTKEIGTGRWFEIPVSVYFAIGAIILVVFLVTLDVLGPLRLRHRRQHESRLSLRHPRRALHGVGLRPVQLARCRWPAFCSRRASRPASRTSARTSRLQSITAAVVGGVSLRGGEGRVLGAVLGAIFITLLTNGMNLIRIESYIQEIAIGIILIVAVIIDRLRDRWRV